MPRVQASVSPPFPEAHAAALEFAKGEESEQSLRTGKHFGRGKPGQPKRQQIDACSPEYEAITRYFQQTLSREPEIHSLSRITQQGVQQRFMSNGDNTLMFHGCGLVLYSTKLLENDGCLTNYQQVSLFRVLDRPRQERAKL